MADRLTYSVTEFAAALGIGRTLAYELVRTGVVSHVRAGRRILVPKDALTTYLNGAESQPGSAR